MNMGQFVSSWSNTAFFSYLELTSTAVETARPFELSKLL